MTQPTWNDPDFDAGVMVRGALWLLQEVGIGNAFTKADIRAAFPRALQADRRIRDLRDFGWVLHTRREDATLTSEQTRFVKQGAAVWNPQERREADPRKAISNKEREAALSRDDHLCTVCGISGAEEYPDDPSQTAVIAVSRRVTVMPDGREEALLTTECKRCKAGLGKAKRRADSVVADIQALSADDQARLLRWINMGKRDLTTAERVWSRYLLLPADARAEVRQLSWPY